MPRLETFPNSTIENKSIYPLRAFESIDQAVDEIQKIISGEKPGIELSIVEAENLADFERSLRAEFENIYKITINSTTLYPEYFSTNEGRKSLREKTGLKLNSDDPAWIKDFLLVNSELISRLGSTTRAELAGESLAHKDQSLLNQIAKTADADGNIFIQDITVPQRDKIVINPAKAKEKIEGLRKFKRSTKKKYEDIEKLEADSPDLKAAKNDILDIYRRRTNILIMDLFPYALLIDQKRQVIGEHRLSTDEREFLAYFA